MPTVDGPLKVLGAHDARAPLRDYRLFMTWVMAEQMLVTSDLNPPPHA